MDTTGRPETGTGDGDSTARPRWRPYRLHENSLSLALLGVFVLLVFGQSVAGYHTYHRDVLARGAPAMGYWQYVASGHFLEAVAENWEAEFLQLGIFVVLTARLFQRGSSKSKDPYRLEPADARPPDRPPADAPWPVRRGGWVLALYAHSLSIALLALFAGAFALHAVAGTAHYNHERAARGEPAITVPQYVGTARFWFESFQNWQSEFLAAGLLVVAGVWLRERGSPESKPVHCPHGRVRLD